MIRAMLTSYSVLMVLAGIGLPCALAFVAWAMGGFQDAYTREDGHDV